MSFVLKTVKLFCYNDSILLLNPNFNIISSSSTYPVFRANLLKEIFILLK